MCSLYKSMLIDSTVFITNFTGEKILHIGLTKGNHHLIAYY